MEPLAAVLARVGPGVRVDQQVGRQGGAALERLAALFARESLLGGMNSSEKEQVVGSVQRPYAYVRL